MKKSGLLFILLFTGLAQAGINAIAYRTKIFNTWETVGNETNQSVWELSSRLSAEICFLGDAQAVKKIVLEMAKNDNIPGVEKIGKSVFRNSLAFNLNAPLDVVHFKVIQHDARQGSRPDTFTRKILKCTDEQKKVVLEAI